MKYLYILIILYFSIKSWFYGLYEFKKCKNKPAGLSIFTLSILRANISIYNIIFKLLIILDYYHFQTNLKIHFELSFEDL